MLEIFDNPKPIPDKFYYFKFPCEDKVGYFGAKTAQECYDKARELFPTETIQMNITPHYPYEYLKTLHLIQNMELALEERVDLMEKILKDFVEHYGPVKVDLRINGKIEEVILFAAINKPKEIQEPFTIVK